MKFLHNLPSKFQLHSFIFITSIFSIKLSYVVKLCGTFHVDVSVVLPLDVLVEVPPVGQPRGAGVLLPGVDHPLGLPDVLADTHNPSVPANDRTNVATGTYYSRQVH